MATKVHTKLTNNHRDNSGNALGRSPNKGGKGNPEMYNKERQAFKTGAIFKKGKK